MISRVLTFILLAAIPSLVIGNKYEVRMDPDSITGTIDGKVLWRYNHDPSEGKPYFHPLATSDGVILTDLRPKDHPWHRGLWFSWKYINEVNYWEENRKTGLSDGKTRIIRIDRKTTPSKVVHIEVELRYTPGERTDPVLFEKRKVVIYPPEKDGSYQIGWSSKFATGAEDVVFDRTPIPGEEGGKIWGGYAGLSLRMSKDVLAGEFLNSDGITNAEAHRKSGRWMAYNFPKSGSVLFMDHPDNLNFPNKWYVAEQMPFFSPVVIHDEPLTLTGKSSFRLQYRVVISPNVTDQGLADNTWSRTMK